MKGDLALWKDLSGNAALPHRQLNIDILSCLEKGAVTFVSLWGAPEMQILGESGVSGTLIVLNPVFIGDRK